MANRKIVKSFGPGGYRFIDAVFQYSGGVAAEPGYGIERVRLAEPLPIGPGLEMVESYLNRLGRPTTAFCACELRSPAPFTEAEFIAFNRVYVQTLERWGIFSNDVNPVARTNVCPEHQKPDGSVLYAFSYTVPVDHDARASFIVAGGGEATEIKGTFRDQIVAYNDHSLGGMREKVRYVANEMTERLEALGFRWNDALATQAYSVFNIGPVFEDELVRIGATPSGLTWHFCRPPVTGLDFEMDVRGPLRELVL
ncbi:MAG: hypothetical protein AAF493_29775 [Pseudomonadota bacterium]